MGELLLRIASSTWFVTATISQVVTKLQYNRASFAESLASSLNHAAVAAAALVLALLLLLLLKLPSMLEACESSSPAGTSCAHYARSVEGCQKAGCCQHCGSQAIGCPPPSEMKCACELPAVLLGVKLAGL